jgi:hypothetical protein
MEKHSVQRKQGSSLPLIKDGLSKNQIRKMASVSVDKLLDEGNVIEVAEALAAMEEFVKAVRKDERYIDFLREELIKNNGRLYTNSGAKIEVCEAAIAYDYSRDATWRMLDEEIKMLQDQKKSREEILRRIAPGRIAVDPETGEVWEGPLKTSKSTYRITLAK